MPQEESKQVEDPINPPAPDETVDNGAPAASKKKSKKKSGKGKKAAVSSGNDNEGSSTGTAAASSRPGNGISSKLVHEILKNNTSLTSEMQGIDPKEAEEMVKRMKLEEILTGMAPGGKNKKDMASYKFWETQPVARFDEDDRALPDGPVRPNPEKVPEESSALIEGFEWATMDLEDDAQMTEVYELLNGHYVEDQEAMFRLTYSPSFLNWALKAPGWKKFWHVGVRVTTSKKLVAFISGIPVNLRVRSSIIKCSEVNFLCIHKKLRSKRLAPVLIKEITRRCNMGQIWQAIYTGGIVLPKPVSTCRYFHRSLEWLKLHEAGFSPMPPNSTKQRQITKYRLPSHTKTKGLRELETKDVPEVHALLDRYLQRFEMAPQYTQEELEHWLVYKEDSGRERVIWCYVIEDPSTKKITDFFSFYLLESAVIKSKKHGSVRAAYLFYYASDVAFSESPDMKKELKIRLNELINDALILAKRYRFDVFNALTLLDNTLFLQEQKFGAGDGQLHYYLFNWRTPYIRGGVDDKNTLDPDRGSGIGMVML